MSKFGVTELAQGTVLQDRYVILRRIDVDEDGQGKGGMGAVYLAQHKSLKRNYAVKQSYFSDDKELLYAFDREARLLASLDDHPALPNVYDHFHEHGCYYLVMKYISGDDLLQKLQEKRGAMPLSEVLGWAYQLLDILEYLHTQPTPIIHRDIKPSNIKLTDQGKITLLDFGLAKGAAGGMSAPLRSVKAATKHYAPMEQRAGVGTDHRSDLYSLAATLYHLLTYRLPPDSLEARAAALAVGQPDPLRPANELNPRVPSAVAAVLHKAMAFDKDRRYANAVEMRRALQEAVEGERRRAAEEARRAQEQWRKQEKARREREDAERKRRERELPQLGGKLTRAAVLAAIAICLESIIGITVLGGGLFGWVSSATLNSILLFVVFPLAALVIIATFIDAISSSRRSLVRELLRGDKTDKSFLVAEVGLHLFLVGLGVWMWLDYRAPAPQPEPLPIPQIEVAQIPGGKFQMGSPGAEGFSNEKPQHQVTIAPFSIGKYEITQAQWRAVAGLPKVKIELNPEASEFKGDDLPVNGVSWEQAVEFCERLSKATGKTYRLPTEAEWEYACRAGTTELYPGDLNAMAWYANNSGRTWIEADEIKADEYEKSIRANGNQPHPVGSKQGNKFGLFDLLGNVREWCQDSYHDDYKGAPTDGSAWLSGGAQGFKVARGGSWFNEKSISRSARRNGEDPTKRYSNYGFRVVMAAPK